MHSFNTNSTQAGLDFTYSTNIRGVYCNTSSHTPAKVKYLTTLSKNSVLLAAMKLGFVPARLEWEYLILTKFINNKDDVVNFCDEPIDVSPNGNPFPTYGY
jgi:hypothetical protein